jgi:hypothetical protein
LIRGVELEALCSWCWGGGVGEKKVGGWVVKGRLGKWCGIGMGSSRSSSSRRSDKKKGAAKLLIGGST